MLLYFLRHGDASQDTHLHDDERPLTEKGKQQARLVGQFLQKLDIDINQILTSPLARARQTGEIIQSFISHPKIVSTEYLTNNSHPAQLFKQLNQLDIESALLVGHEPFLSEAISILIAGKDKAQVEMKKCSLAAIEIPLPIKPGSGTLLWLIYVRIFEHLIN